MKVVRLLLMLAFLLVGLVVGALNSQPIQIDFAFASIPTTSGVAIIVALLSGTLIGTTLVFLGVVIPLYSKLRQANKQVAANRVNVPAAASTGDTETVHGL